MKSLLRAFFSFCFVFGLICGANSHTVRDMQRIDSALMKADVRNLTLQEISWVEI